MARSPSFRQVARIRDIGDLPSKILRNLQTKDTMNEVGETISAAIRRRTRAGYGCSSDDGSRERLAPLAPTTIEIRANFSDLSSETSPQKSNLTMTGRMLDELGWTSTNKKTTILFTTQRSSIIAGYAHDGSRNRPKRPFLFLTKTEMRQAIRILQEKRDELFRRYLSSL